MRHEHELSVLDDDGNETDQTTKVSIGEFSDVLLIEVDGISVYVERQGDVVGVYVGTDETGRSDATLSIRMNTKTKDAAVLRYDSKLCDLESSRSA